MSGPDKRTTGGIRETPYGWVVTAAVFGCNALAVGYYRAFGVFFVEIMDTFQSSTSLTSLIMGVQSAVLAVSAVVVHGALLPVVGERVSAVLGGCLMASGMMLATFATSMPFLIFSISVLVGMGNAMVYGPGLVLLGRYFERRRALAMAVANTGSSVGSMTLPLLATYLLQHYGLGGAWLLYGAVTLHLCVFASLYRPPAGPKGTPDNSKLDSEAGVSSSKPLLLDSGDAKCVEENKSPTATNGYSGRTFLSRDSEDNGEATKSLLEDRTSKDVVTKSFLDSSLKSKPLLDDVKVSPSESLSQDPVFQDNEILSKPSLEIIARQDDVKMCSELLLEGSPSHSDTKGFQGSSSIKTELFENSLQDYAKSLSTSLLSQERGVVGDGLESSQTDADHELKQKLADPRSPVTCPATNSPAAKASMASGQKTNSKLCSDQREVNGQLLARQLASVREGSETRTFCSAENVSYGNTSANNRSLRGRRSSTLGDLRMGGERIPSVHQHHGGGSLASISAVLHGRLKDVVLHSSHPYLLVPTTSTQSLRQEVLHKHPSTSIENEEGQRDNGVSVFGSKSIISQTLQSGGSSTELGAEEARQRRSLCGRLWGKVSFDRALLRMPRFWLVLAYVCVGIVGATSAGVYLPALCLELGISKGDTALVLTVWGALNLLGRLLFGLLADRQWLRPSHISLLAFLAIGLLFQLLPLLPRSSLGAMVALASVYGVLEGAYFTMLPLIIIDFLTLDRFSTTLGFVQLSQAACATIFYPLLGRLRDVSGNYYATFHCIGACALMACLLLLLESGAHALKTKKSSADDKELSSK